MLFADHLTREQIRKFNQLRLFNQSEKEKVIEPKPKKKREILSRKDIEELMGTKRDTYKRVGGALRRK